MFNRFYRLEIHSPMVGIFDLACELLPQWKKKLYLCTVAPLPSLLPPPLPPSQTKCTVYTGSVWLGGGWGVWSCVVDHILQEFYTLFLTKVRTYKIASPLQTKMTSEDDILGLVSLKFLRPWVQDNSNRHKGSLRSEIRNSLSPWIWHCDQSKPKKARWIDQSEPLYAPDCLTLSWKKNKKSLWMDCPFVGSEGRTETCQTPIASLW